MLISLESVNKIYNAGEPNEVAALHDIDLAVGEGEMVCLQGPSGSGKTTLLSIIGCVFGPTSGRAAIGGRRISRLPDHFLTRCRREMIGFVFQHFNMLEHLSVLDNVTLPLLPLGVSPRERAQRADALLDKLAIGHRRHFPARQLSGGEMQRAAIARALINNPPIIVADEPTAHLDGRLAREIIDLLAALKDEGRTIVISSHDPFVAGHPKVDRIVGLRDGRIAESGG